MREYDEEGNILEPRPHIVAAFWPDPPKRQGVYCKTGHFMKLLPVNRDITEGLWWKCDCKCISLTGRDNCFERHRQLAINMFQLHKLEYNRQTNHFDIESSEWISHDGSRLNATRRQIGQTETEDILTKFQEVIEKELDISFDSFQD